MRVDEAQAHPERSRRVTVLGSRVLAAACAQRALPLLTFSSDQVFDGGQTRPYVESSPTAPLNIFGASQAEAEQLVLKLWPEALVVRTSSFFDRADPSCFLYRTLQQLAAGQPVWAADDRVVSPTYVPDLVEASLDLLLDGTAGVWHLANSGAVSWADFARLGAKAANLHAAELVTGVSSSSELRAPRPAYSVLDRERGRLMPALEDAVDRFCSAAPWRA